MAKSKTVYVCSNCGAESVKWQGRCPDCGEFNTFEERLTVPAVKSASKVPYQAQGISADPIGNISTAEECRYKTGLSELDRVLGGGIVKGSLVLLSGDPGIGKSTILLQICEYICREHEVLYVSGEESKRQIKLRADRLGVHSDNLLVMTGNNAEAVASYIESERPGVVIIDSIQTMSLPELSSVPGSLTQVRECTNLFLRTAKDLEIPVIIVGHVNKDGAIAGPKVLEHIVDAVLYFEGEKSLSCRILRAVKNRFGSTNEIGMFEMTDRGMSQIENPSGVLISGRPKNVSGTCVACVMEGSRPILAEVQGLAASSPFGNPRRTSNGFDYNRMSLILAVLEKRGGYIFSGSDVYLNVAGGLRPDEPAADLPAAIALISSLKDEVVNEKTVVFGELGLAGEVRAVTNAVQRVSEAARLGFERCVIPIHNVKDLPDNLKNSIEVVGIRTIRRAYEACIN